METGPNQGPKRSEAEIRHELNRMDLTIHVDEETIKELKAKGEDTKELEAIRDTHLATKTYLENQLKKKD